MKLLPRVTDVDLAYVVPADKKPVSNPAPETRKRSQSDIPKKSPRASRSKRRPSPLIRHSASVPTLGLTPGFLGPGAEISPLSTHSGVENPYGSLGCGDLKLALDLNPNLVVSEPDLENMKVLREEDPTAVGCHNGDGGHQWKRQPSRNTRLSRRNKRLQQDVRRVHTFHAGQLDGPVISSALFHGWADMNEDADAMTSYLDITLAHSLPSPSSFTSGPMSQSAPMDDHLHD